MKWSSIQIEFDVAVQKGEITQGQIQEVLQNLGLSGTVAVKLIKSPKTKTLIGMELRYPDTMTPSQVTALVEGLKSVWAAYFTPPILDPFVPGGGGVAASGGLVLATVLPYAAGTTVNVELLYANLGGQPTSTAVQVAARQGGNTEIYAVTPNPYPGAPYYLNGTQLHFLSAGSPPSTAAQTVTIPKAATITVKDAAGVSVVLPARTRDIVLTPRAGAYSVIQSFWMDAAGRLFLAWSTSDAVVLDQGPLSYDDALALGAW